METSDDNYIRSDFLLIVLVIGIFLLVSGIIVLIVSIFSSGQESTSSGIIIFIGPIPIVIGSGPDATWLITITLILAITSLVLFVIMNRRSKKT